MRHRIKKIPTLSKLSHICNHLLHSDESTYFYKDKLGKVKNILYSPSIPLLGGAALLLVLGCMISPNASISGVDKASAISEEECRGNTRVAMSLTGVTGDTVSLVNNNVNSDITNNTLSKLSQDFNIIACNVKNYKLYVQAESSLLKNQSAPDALLPVGDNIDESAFPDNTWGYNISPAETPTSTYNSMPDLSATIPEAYVASRGTSYQGKDFTISFAAKFTGTKAAGHYTSDILLSLVADPNITLSSIDTMQEMTPVVCSNSEEHETKRLEDIRDHKSYWVAKLKDGNCWMTQNLDLDLNVKDDAKNIDTTKLTPETSDVDQSWDVPTDLKSGVWESDPANSNPIKFFDPGMYIFTNPLAPEACIAENGNLNTEDCKNKGWANVDGLSPSSDPNFGTNVIDGTYNAHYLEGNLYSWGAATAGQSATITYPNVNAANSICPRGWTLPTAQRNVDDRPNNASRSFAYLLESYGWQWNNISSEEYGWEGYHSTDLTSTTGQYVFSAPLYFVPSGIVTQKSFYNPGAGSWITSATSSNEGGIYYLLINAIDNMTTDHTTIAPSTMSGRYEGESVRCVAR